MYLNNSKGNVVINLLDYMFVHNNLYLISEGFEISLTEHLPYLLQKNQENSLVSILMIHDILKILKNVYS